MSVNAVGSHLRAVNINIQESIDIESLGYLQITKECTLPVRFPRCSTNRLVYSTSKVSNPSVLFRLSNMN